METKMGVKEFRAHLPSYLDPCRQSRSLVTEEAIGYYIPAHRGRNQAELDALKQTAAKLEVMMSDLGVSEEGIVADFKTHCLSGSCWVSGSLSYDQYHCESSTPREAI